MQLSFNFTDRSPVQGETLSTCELMRELEAFRDFGKATSVLEFPSGDFDIPVFVNEFWTARQRAAHSLHEISYRACFKPQLPRFFMDRLTVPGDAVYDPFMGRGTTLLEAALRGRRPFGCDINPLSRILVEPRLTPPTGVEIAERLLTIDLTAEATEREDLLVFYHPETLRSLTNLRSYMLEREADGRVDDVDRWIRMVATNRLTGHSPGFLSGYTLPPNQAASVRSQRRINARREQTPPRRNLTEIILKKSRSLLKDLDEDERALLVRMHKNSLLVTGCCSETSRIDDGSVQLVVTSPPFLDVVNYKADNWLRCWFNGIDLDHVPVWQLKKVEDWQQRMTSVFREMRRILMDGGHVAFEVGEVRGGKILMETLVVPAAIDAGLKPLLVLVNDQEFTKTANCWGVSNRSRGTNTNRVVLLRKGE